jgi:hypothetical protein
MVLILPCHILLFVSVYGSTYHWQTVWILPQIDVLCLKLTQISHAVILVPRTIGVASTSSWIESDSYILCQIFYISLLIKFSVINQCTCTCSVKFKMCISCTYRTLPNCCESKATLQSQYTLLNVHFFTLSDCLCTMKLFQIRSFDEMQQEFPF